MILKCMAFCLELNAAAQGHGSRFRVHLSHVVSDKRERFRVPVAQGGRTPWQPQKEPERDRRPLGSEENAAVGPEGCGIWRLGLVLNQFYRGPRERTWGSESWGLGSRVCVPLLTSLPFFFYERLITTTLFMDLVEIMLLCDWH